GAGLVVGLLAGLSGRRSGGGRDGGRPNLVCHAARQLHADPPGAGRQAPAHRGPAATVATPVTGGPCRAAASGRQRRAAVGGAGRLAGRTSCAMPRVSSTAISPALSAKITKTAARRRR